MCIIYAKDNEAAGGEDAVDGVTRLQMLRLVGVVK